MHLRSCPIAGNNPDGVNRRFLHLSLWSEFRATRSALPEHLEVENRGCSSNDTLLRPDSVSKAAAEAIKRLGRLQAGTER
jgi:hypothetical protein